jgi:hypothetical protein
LAFAPIRARLNRLSEVLSLGWPLWLERPVVATDASLGIDAAQRGVAVLASTGVLAQAVHRFGGIRVAEGHKLMVQFDTKFADHGPNKPGIGRVTRRDAPGLALLGKGE